jgi:aryl-alcohol dehydrogenase-like predicted oxidoreductase
MYRPYTLSMEMRVLGRTGITVPVIGMGTWRTFDVSGRAAEENCRRLVSVALDKGARLFDSSPMYGRAERVLARALHSRREEALVATKVWASTAREGRAQIAQALEWFGGRVDLYQVHNLLAWRDHLPYLEERRALGQVTVIGVTHYSHAAFPEMLRVLESERFSQIQVPYNVADRLVEAQVLPAAEQHGAGVIVMQPLGAGSLMRAVPTQKALRPLEPFGVWTWAQALLKWILSDRRVHAVIPATSSLAHLGENLAAGDPPWLDADARRYVEEVMRDGNK